jgi:hypothetical protein
LNNTIKSSSSSTSGRKTPPPPPPPLRKTTTTTATSKSSVVTGIDEATTARLIEKLNRISMPRAPKLMPITTTTDESEDDVKHISAPRPLTSIKHIHDPTLDISPSIRPRRASIPTQDMVVDFDLASPNTNNNNNSTGTSTPTTSKIPPPLPARKSPTTSPKLSAIVTDIPRVPPVAPLPLSKPAVDIVINRLGYSPDRVIQLGPVTSAAVEERNNALNSLLLGGSTSSSGSGSGSGQKLDDQMLSPWQRYHKRASELFSSAAKGFGTSPLGNSSTALTASTGVGTTTTTTTTTIATPTTSSSTDNNISNSNNNNRFQLSTTRTISESSHRVTQAFSNFWNRFTFKPLTLTRHSGEYGSRKVAHRRRRMTKKKNVTTAMTPTSSVVGGDDDNSELIHTPGLRGSLLSRFTTTWKHPQWNTFRTGRKQPVAVPVATATTVNMTTTSAAVSGAGGSKLNRYSSSSGVAGEDQHSPSLPIRRSLSLERQVLRKDDPSVRYSKNSGLIITDGWLPNIAQDFDKPLPTLVTGKATTTTTAATSGGGIDWSHSDVWL